MKLHEVKAKPLWEGLQGRVVSGGPDNGKSAMRMKLRISEGEASMGGVPGEGGKPGPGSNTKPGEPKATKVEDESKKNEKVTKKMHLGKHSNFNDFSDGKKTGEIRKNPAPE